jgi:hypothetical protein
MGDLRLHIKDLKQALAKPPADMGAWHWIWMAHSGLTGRTEVELVSPAIALRTALDLLEGS